MHGLTFSAEQTGYLEKSVAAHKKARNQRVLAARKIADQQRALATEQKAKAKQRLTWIKRITIAASLAGVLAIVAAGAAGFGFFQRNRAQGALANEQVAKEHAMNRLAAAIKAIEIASTIGASTEKYRSNVDARTDFEKLLALLAVLESADPDDSSIITALGNVQLAIANLHLGEEEFEQAIESYDKVEAIRQRIADERPEFQRKYANVFMNRGQAKRLWAKTVTNPAAQDRARTLVDEATEDIARAQAIRIALQTEVENRDRIDADWKEDPLEGKYKLIRDLAFGYYTTREYDKALPLAEEVAVAKQDDPENRRLLGVVLTQRGEKNDIDGRGEEAQADIERAISILMPLAEEYPDVDTYQRDLAVAYRTKAYYQYGKGEFALAAAAREEQRDLLKGLVTRRPTNSQFRNDLFEAYRGLLYATYQAYVHEQLQQDLSCEVESNILVHFRTSQEVLSPNRLRYWAMKMSEFFADMVRQHEPTEGVRSQLTKRQKQFIAALVELHPRDPFYQETLPAFPSVVIPKDLSTDQNVGSTDEIDRNPTDAAPQVIGD